MWVDQVESLSLNHQRIKNMVVLLMHDILWNLIWGKRLSPFVGILTHPGCLVCWAINMYLKKQHPFDAINPLSTKLSWRLTLPNPKKLTLPKPCAIFCFYFLDFFEKNLQEPCVQKESSQQTPPTDFTTRSRSSVSRIRRVPISGVGHRMFGGRWKPPREVRESRGRKSLLVGGIPFFGWECEVWSYVWKPFFKMPRKNPWLSWHNPGLNCVEAWKNMRWFENWGVDAHVWTRRV